MTEAWYDTAQICMNGHVINTRAQTSSDRNKKFCSDCGAATVTNCRECSAPIRGHRHNPNMHVVAPPRPAPKFCHNCGVAYPWTESHLQAAIDLAHEQEKLSQDEKEELSAAIDTLVRDTPHTPVAAERFKRYMTKLGENAAGGFRVLLVDIVSETVKKLLLWP